jgi:hypothetical protein
VSTCLDQPCELNEAFLKDSLLTVCNVPQYHRKAQRSTDAGAQRRVGDRDSSMRFVPEPFVYFRNVAECWRYIQPSCWQKIVRESMDSRVSAPVIQQRLNFGEMRR